MRYLAVDIETTGLNQENDRIIEVGAVLFEQGERVKSFSKLINPLIPLPPRIVELTGITEEMLLKAGTESEVLSEFYEFAGEEILLGHNILFDFSFLKVAASRMGKSFIKRGLDTLHLARLFHADLPSKSLDSMCKHYDIVRHESHRAVSDAIAAALLFEKMATNFRAEWEESFTEKELSYEPKKQEPMTAKQKKYLLDLVNYHRIEIPPQLDQFTKSSASKYIDKIILAYGMRFRR